MARVELVHPQGSHQTLSEPLINKCDLFKNNPGLVITPYRVESRVSFEDFKDFVSALEDKSIDINDRNFSGLSQLSEEFGFHVLLMKISTHRSLPRLSDVQTTEIQSRISALEKRAGRQELQIEELQCKFFSQLQRVEADLVHLTSELEAYRNAKNIEILHPTSVTSPPNAPAKPPPMIPRLDSLIVSEYPLLFEEFRTKHFNLLWRGSRDGFSAVEFHHHCDGHANTLTLISDTDENVFGGFTPVEWESRVWNGKDEEMFKSDNKLQSFLFTLKNPHGIPARRFELKCKRKQYAIYCDSAYGPIFTACILVSDNCNTNTKSFTHIGTKWGDRVYVNDTIVENCFTGAEKFTVKEIEVFEITE